MKNLIITITILLSSFIAKSQNVWLYGTDKEKYDMAIKVAKTVPERVKRGEVTWRPKDVNSILGREKVIVNGEEYKLKKVFLNTIKDIDPKIAKAYKKAIRKINLKIHKEWKRKERIEYEKYLGPCMYYYNSSTGVLIFN